LVLGQSPLEDMVMTDSFWRGKRVFVSGHTGFKGAWLCLWLVHMGAEVHGFALEPPTRPSFFEVCNLAPHLKTHTVGDIRDAGVISQTLKAANPEIVLHLAAQALVRESYLSPAETYHTNVMGTVNLLEAVRLSGGVRALVNVTTDKCYENREWLWPYRESEALGGFDPYSSSKACSELVTASYRRSFLREAGVHTGTARSGNVIGGGDWASDRLIPDFFRAIDAGEELVIRYPDATRPWQHVLEPLGGYLTLAERLYREGDAFSAAWNFGPEQADAFPVKWIAEYLCSRITGASWRASPAPHPHEAGSLQLDISKAKASLGWHPRWGLETALEHTLAWHQAWKKGQDMTELSLDQIRTYEACS
jgi:CDP-glucose 4,6-dehydratase